MPVSKVKGGLKNHELHPDIGVIKSKYSFTVNPNDILPVLSQPTTSTGEWVGAYRLLTKKGKHVGYVVAAGRGNFIFLFNLAGKVVAELGEAAFTTHSFRTSLKWALGYTDRNGLEVKAERYPRIPSVPSDKIVSFGVQIVGKGIKTRIIKVVKGD